jgi:uncharacterized alkaline shock family protein YloU
MIIDKLLEHKVKTYAFVGPSGTGKSYRAQMVAGEKDIEYIIDDGLLIKGNEVVAGISAKKAPTKIETVKNALFQDELKRNEMIKAIKKERPRSILILGTSDGMVEKIAANLNLPKIEKIIYIEEVSSPEQIEQARKIRKEQGKHVVPVPTFEIKEQFSGYLLDPLKMFEKQDKVYREKSVIRPTFSYLGKFTISDKVLKDIIQYEGIKTEGLARLSKIDVEEYQDGIKIKLSVDIKFGNNIPKVTKELQTIIARELDYMTGINILAIDIFVKGIVMEKK